MRAAGSVHCSTVAHVSQSTLLLGYTLPVQLACEILPTISLCRPTMSAASAERGEVKIACEGYPPLKINLRLKEMEISGLDGTILKVEMSREGADAGVNADSATGEGLSSTSFIGHLLLRRSDLIMRNSTVTRGD